MKCPKPDRWTELVYGRVNIRERDILLKHAVNCDDCDELLDQALGVVGLLRQALSPAPQGGLADRVLDSLAQPSSDDDDA